MHHTGDVLVRERIALERDDEAPLAHATAPDQDAVADALLFAAMRLPPPVGCLERPAVGSRPCKSPMGMAEAAGAAMGADEFVVSQLERVYR